MESYFRPDRKPNSNHDKSNVTTCIAFLDDTRQIVIAGSDEGMSRVLKAARMSGARKAEWLLMSVPSHCPLLEPVAAALRTSLQGMQLQRPNMAEAGANLCLAGLDTRYRFLDESLYIHPFLTLHLFLKLATE